jgi:hypothetical protein
MWAIAVYHQVSMFSLKPADATSTGGRSLLVPTPFSIKMALLDAALRLYGVETGSTYFPLIRDLRVAISPPPRIVANNCFVRIHKPRREKGGQQSSGGDEVEEESEGPFIRSVAFREYVQYSGPLGLAVEVDTQEAGRILLALLIQVTCLGKRGSLFQLDSPPWLQEQLPIGQGYLRLDLDIQVSGFPESTGEQILQILDDCSSKLTFQQANAYSGEALTRGRDRILRQVVLPYRLARSSRGFSLYQRTDLRR